MKTFLEENYKFKSFRMSEYFVDISLKNDDGISKHIID